MKNILICGGCGFCGSNLAIYLKMYNQFTNHVTCLDSLKRRGSELNIPRIQKYGIKFVHGDIRNREDLFGLGDTDILIECSAEPSVLAGYGGSPLHTVNANFIGTLNCLEYARKKKAAFIFLSSSRVYPYNLLNILDFVEEETRFELKPYSLRTGVSKYGIDETFPIDGLRSLYGTTKLCSEYFVQEFSSMYDIPAIINRCGVIAGPWQMGKADQGVITYWLVRHLFHNSVKYIGHGGTGKQVRDVLHIDDLCVLLTEQIENVLQCNGEVYNVGGGHTNSISLRELTTLCEKISSRRLEIIKERYDREADIPYYVTDNTKVMKVFPWRPRKTLQDIVSDTWTWLCKNRNILRPILK